MCRTHPLSPQQHISFVPACLLACLLAASSAQPARKQGDPFGISSMQPRAQRRSCPALSCPGHPQPPPLPLTLTQASRAGPTPARTSTRTWTSWRTSSRRSPTSGWTRRSWRAGTLARPPAATTGGWVGGWAGPQRSGQRCARLGLVAGGTTARPPATCSPARPAPTAQRGHPAQPAPRLVAPGGHAPGGGLLCQAAGGEGRAEEQPGQEGPAGGEGQARSGGQQPGSQAADAAGAAQWRGVRAGAARTEAGMPCAKLASRTGALAAIDSAAGCPPPDRQQPAT
jgi:hypothetical protein